MDQKRGKGDDVSLKRDFWQFLLSYGKTNDFFSILRQNWTRWACYKKKILSSNLPSSSTSQMTRNQGLHHEEGRGGHVPFNPEGG